eukprot:1195136-Prorocentrum_minimum.AAC.1
MGAPQNSGFPMVQSFPLATKKAPPRSTEPPRGAWALRGVRGWAWPQLSARRPNGSSMCPRMLPGVCPCPPPFGTVSAPLQ